MEPTPSQPPRDALLLHVCCAPCSTAVIERLAASYQVVLFWCNPNITDRAEYDRRLAEVRRFAEATGVDLVVASCDPRRWEEAVDGLEHESEGGERCDICYRLRLEATAREAEAQGIRCFTTTLSVSPHKRFERIASAGEEAAHGLQTTFLAEDFKQRGGFERSTHLSRQYGLYRQDYCGCEFSKRERDQRRARRRSGRRR